MTGKPIVKRPPVFIATINTVLHPDNHTFSVIGLGSDEKVYAWNYALGEWVQQWKPKGH